MKNKPYMNLGFIDFMAYYVPGVLILLSVGIIIYHPETGFTKLFMDFSKNPYTNGAIWTILSLVIPYILGHLIFPIGSWIVKIKLFKAKPKFDNDKNSGEISKLKKTCKYLAKPEPEYCLMESFDFANCLFKCFQKSDPSYDDLMITRFRTLSRFCRSMLFPVILWIIILGGLGGYNIYIGILLLPVLFGLGSRHKKYETRWKNGVCIGKIFEEKHKVKRPRRLFIQKAAGVFSCLPYT